MGSEDSGSDTPEYDPDADGPEYPRVIKFSLGYSTISAIAEASYDLDHQHVLRLTILRGIWQRTLAWLLPTLPLAVQKLVNRYWPGGSLPGTVVLKKLKPEWDDEFEKEKKAYKKLGPLQGRVIPVFYGEGRCDDGTRAFVLSEVDGVVAYKQAPPPLPKEEFQQRLEAIYHELAAFNMSYMDTNLGNILLTQDGAKLVDLESTWEAEPNDDLNWEIKCSIKMYMRQYSGYLNSLDDSPIGPIMPRKRIIP